MVYPGSEFQEGPVNAVQRIVLAFLALWLACGGARAGGPSLLFDPAKGTILSQDRAGEPWYPASLTKLMTAYVVFHKLHEGKLTLDQKIAVSEEAHAQPPSKIGVPVGGTVSVDFALQALLVYSANDMAYVLAEAASGSVDRFVAEMNDSAAALGMTATHFANPNGLFDPRHVSTARDMALLVTALFRDFPDDSHYFSQAYLKVGKRRLTNRNALIRQMKDADGMKTGFVCDSGYNLIASASRDGRRLVAIVFGARTGKQRTDLAQMLLVDGFARDTREPEARVQDIVNTPLGSIVPADMTAAVCRQKPTVTFTSAQDLKGWGISLGNYDTAEKADMALRGRLLSRAGRDVKGTAGVVALPKGQGFTAMVWDVDHNDSLSMCAMYHLENAYCDVMTPDHFAEIAAAVPAEPAGTGKTQSQGSDDGKSRTGPQDSQN
jgi:D-alanyl-D-alanine carboxypeptidase